MTRQSLGRIAFCVIAVLFVLAVPVFLVTGSVAWAVNDPSLYNRGFQKYDISLYTGITDADLHQAGADIRRYFNSSDEPLSVRTRVLGVEREIFNQREVVHMRDVKGLIWGVYLLAGVSAVYMLGIVVGGFVWHRRSFVDKLASLTLWGGMLTLAFVIAVGLFALLGFDTLFLKFHQLSFSNDFWQLDPRRDYLIIMFPLGFWFDATMRVALTAVGGAVFLAVASGAYLVYQRWTLNRLVTGESTTVEGTSANPATED